MSTLTSILGTDYQNLSRPSINGNFQALNADKAEVDSPALTGIPTAPTASVATSTTQLATTEFVKNVVGGGLTTYIPICPIPLANVANAMTINSSVVGHTAFFSLPTPMVVNKVSVQISSILSQGSLGMGIYSSDGQTKEIDTTFASVVGNSIVSNNVSSVLLASGSHYMVFAAKDGTAEFRCAIGSSSHTLNACVLGKAVYFGSQSVVGGVMPTSFTPDNLPAASPYFITLRLDN